MTMAAVHASLSHLVSGQDRNKAAISDAINAVVSAHQHGGKATFDDRVTDLRVAVENTFLTLDAIHETARASVGMPHEPKPAVVDKGEAQSAEDAAATRRVRVARTSPVEGE